MVSVLTILKSKLSHIEVRVDIPDGLTINCYQVGLNQIFMNLISNAIDVLPASNGQIYFQAKTTSDGLIELRVSDNGHGMSQSIQDRMFDPFFTTKEVGKGTGLGLHIVQKEVERHAGTISVESKIDVGTTFTIRLPNIFETSKISEAA